MTEPEFEERLRRYRPAGPPPELRARIVASARARRAWPWAAAAAVLLTATLALQFARTEIHQALTSGDPEQEELQILVEMLGGGEAASEEARRVLWERQLRDLAEAAQAGRRGQ